MDKDGKIYVSPFEQKVMLNNGWNLQIEIGGIDKESGMEEYYQHDNWEIEVVAYILKATKLVVDKFGVPKKDEFVVATDWYKIHEVSYLTEENTLFISFVY